MKPITAVVLNDYCHINGGASRIAIDEAVGPAASDMEVIFLGANGPICDELKNANIKVICLEQPELLNIGKNPGVMLQGLWNKLAYTRMADILSTLDKNRTIVHLHGYTKALSSSPVKCAYERGFHVLCTLHDFFTACPNGAFFDYVKSAPCPKRGLSLDCISTHCDKRHYAHKLYRVGRSAVQKYYGKLPDGVMDYITLSKRSADILKPYLPAGAHYHALENLIEVQHAAPVDAASNQSIVAVGRLDVEKGIEVLLEASHRTGIKLTLVGDGPLRAQAEALPGCRITGWVSPQQVMKELEFARCLAFPSIWYEAYGLVVSEAASRGIPAIVSDISAASERVEDQIHGWIVKAGDMDDLSRALESSKDDATIREMARAAYDRFWNNPPTRQNHMDALSAIYETILSGRLSR